MLNLLQLSATLAQAPNGGRCDDSHEHISLIGTSSDGKFLTAPAKGYPSNMNRMLAEVAFSFCQERTVVGLPQWEAFYDSVFSFFACP